ncbi:MAG: chemotaxis protein CheW [Thermodesulfovibrionales bacterium]
MDIAKIRKKIKDTQEHQTQQKTDTPLALTSITREVEVVQSSVELGDSIVELLTFKLAKEEYAFRISEIQEIIKPQSITGIPRARPYLMGITSLRGKIIPVIDLKMMLSLRSASGGEEDEKKRQKILILKGTKGPLGALIDRVIGVMRPSISKIVETPAHLPEAEMKFIDGVTIVDGRFISIIKTEEVVEAL